MPQNIGVRKGQKRHFLRFLSKTAVFGRPKPLFFDKNLKKCRFLAFAYTYILRHSDLGLRND